jgi:phage regulator Rha-like protein
MSSLEIAKLTGKDHSKVMSGIKKVLEEVEINHAVFGEVYKAGNGQDQPCFNLPLLN